MVQEQSCPLCNAPVHLSPRYPRWVCSECYKKAAEEYGWPLAFLNEAMSGGFIAYYADTKEKRDPQICHIDGMQCWADETYMGGIVIQPYGENS